MIILVADKLDPAALETLKRERFQVVPVKSLTPETLPPEAASAEILVVRSTVVSAAHLPALPRLKLIIRAGSGIDTIDATAAALRGIQVLNCPGKNADAVAEMALGLLLAADRRIPDATQTLRGGHWQKGPLGQGRGLKGRTLGIVGLGAVGRAMARKALGLEMKVVAFSRNLSPDKARAAGVDYAASLHDLARASDAVSLHVASVAETRNYIGADFFASLKPGALFVNTSRGEVVDRAALIEAIKTRGLRAGLDVFAGEPKVSEADFQDTELASLAAACAPHLGASTDQASEAVAAEVVRLALAFRDGG
jgi:D-3-phosphoglycerate dehydrogenase